MGQPSVHWLFMLKVQAEDMLQISATELALHLAISHGRIKVVQWLDGQEHGVWSRPSLCLAAAKSGCLDIMIYLRSRRVPCPWNLAASQAAARKPGNALMLRWMAAQAPPCPMNQQTFSLAVCFCLASCTGDWSLTLSRMDYLSFNILLQKACHSCLWVQPSAEPS